MIKELKAEFKKLIGLFAEEDKEEEFSDTQKVYSPSEIKITDSKVELIDADGNIQTAPDGEYPLEDGTVIKVKDGLIVKDEATGSPDAETQEPLQAEEVPVEEPASQEASADQLNAMKQEIADLKTQVDEIKSLLQGSKEDADKFSEHLNELTKTLKVIAKVPAEFSKTSHNNYVKDDKEQKMVELARLFKK